MAYELKLRGTNDEVKIRSPWAAALLPIITLGIYHLVWWYRINRELRDFGRARGYDLGDNPTASLLALFPGGFIIVPALVTYWRGTKRVQGAARLAGREPVNGWISLILYLVISPAFWAYLQISLNDVWRAEAEPLPGVELPPAPARDAMPPRLPDEPAPSGQSTPPRSPGATPPQPGATPPSPGATPPQPGATPPQPGATPPSPGGPQPPPQSPPPAPPGESPPGPPEAS